MSISPRPPIIAVLGHVDHGKTSLLDAIRKTNVAGGESGGITQHIGAYQVTYHDRLITFIDTPGHAAFTAMRARGGQIADLAVLVVAADDGVMPQTRESISHINSANIPFVVALNKIDLPDSRPERVKGQLAEAGVLVEGFGGNVPIIEVSATRQTNLDLLLENLLLLADLQEIKADPDGILKAVVIESNLDKNRGPLATVIIKNGTLSPGDFLTTVPTKPNEPAITAKARALIDWQNQNLKNALPSTPVRVLGFSTVPPVGAIITRPETLDQIQTQITTTSAEVFSITKNPDRLNIILKADVVGTLEAIIGNLPENIHLVHAGTGSVNESDILLADTSSARIYGFRVKPTPSAKKLAEIEKVPISYFDTIYDLLDLLKDLSQKKTDELNKEIILGEAKVLKIFNLPEFQVIGALVTSGSISQGDNIHLQRADGSIKNAKITSLKIGTKNIDKAKKDQEFGLIISPKLDAKPDDLIIAFQLPQL